MYLITIPKNFTRADGKPFRKIKEDKEGQGIRALDDDGKPLPMTKNAQGIDTAQFQTEKATYLDMLGAFLNNLFDIVTLKAKEDKNIKLLTYEDSAFLTDIFRAIHVANDTLELERATYEWLLSITKTWSTAFFGGNAKAIGEPIEKAQSQEPTRAETRRGQRQSAEKRGQPPSAKAEEDKK